MHLYASGKGKRRRQEALLQQGKGETGSELLLVARSFQPGARVTIQEIVELPLLRTHDNFKGNDTPFQESLFPESGVDVRFQTPHHHGPDLLGRGRDCSGEAKWIQQFEQCGKRLGEAIVRCGCEEKAVFEIRCNPAYHPCAVRILHILSAPRWRDVVGFVDDQDIPHPDASGGTNRSRALLELPQGYVPLDIIYAGNKPGIGGPRVHIYPVLPAKIEKALAVHDLEVQAELLRHLVLPLFLEACRAKDQYLPCPPSRDHLLEYQTGFHRFPEPHIISDQKGDAWHIEGTDNRLQLVTLELDGSPERCVE